MHVHQMVLLTPSLSLRLPQLLPYKQSEQSSFHSPYTLSSSVSCKPFICHSCRNCRGWGTNNSHSGSRRPATMSESAAGRVLAARHSLLQTRSFLSHSCVLFSRRKHQLHCFQPIPHSLPQYAPGWGMPTALTSHDNLLFPFARPTMNSASQPGIHPDPVWKAEAFRCFEFRVSSFDFHCLRSHHA
jgi:hypothetical protein